ncbi:hypothetical protein [Kitasatospora sp. NPDC093679]|uniref:hypothetical protein n=1 Tax=Kitasatospora sp. NPDC093679 TaxID=3154983 RepID=UPI00343F2934
MMSSTENRQALPAPLAAHLAPTARNIASAAMAVAKLASSGWQPLCGYPGADTHWHVRCLVCGQWDGLKFYSHLRRGKPAFRHPGCLPEAQRTAKLAEITAALSTACPCPAAHPVTAEDAAEAIREVSRARDEGDEDALSAQLARLLGRCPAAAARAEAVQAAASA